MRVIVLGSGVIGVCTAYYLARSGVAVTVLDRGAAPASETSQANAGQVSPGYATPWAAPGIPLKALKWLCQRHAPLAIRPDGSWFQLQWVMAMLKECNPSRYALNKGRMVMLAEYSRDQLRALRQDLPLAYEHRSQGTLQLFRTAAQLDAAQRDVAVLAQAGVPHQLLAREALCAVEPGLRHSLHHLVGGLRLPNDETGDCALFTTQLAEHARALGVRFCFDTEVQALVRDGATVNGVQVRDAQGVRTLQADAVVVALASHSRTLLAPLGARLPVYPVKGYSLTLPLANAEAAPVSTVLDESFKVAVTRFDRRIRVGGMAELSGHDLRLNPARRATLEKVVQELFPGSGTLAQGEFWTGLRPMTPEGTPLVGATPWPGLYLNTGHGTLGWTMAAGSGRLLSDLIVAQRPDIDPQGLSPVRQAAWWGAGVAA